MGEQMSKNTSSKSISKPAAKKTSARSKPPEKRVRRVIFKTDQWYAGAAVSIGIAGRAKGARSMQLWMPRAENDGE